MIDCYFCISVYATRHEGLICYACGDLGHNQAGPCKDQNERGNLTTCGDLDDYSCAVGRLTENGVVTYFKGCYEGIQASGCLYEHDDEEGITSLTCLCDTDECNDSFDPLNR